MFEPPRCPYSGCPNHLQPEGHFYHRRGSYWPRCRAHPVPRFHCLGCGRSFSRQTFRSDYRDHRPDLNAQLFKLLTSGIGLRQCSRLLNLSWRCTELKFRKLARHLRDLNLNLRGPLRPGSTLQLDELETFEGTRGTRPLSVPVLIESESRFTIWAESAPIRPRGKMTRKRRSAIARDEASHGKRVDRSRASLRRTLARGAELATDLEQVLLFTDEKSSYPSLAREAFGCERLVHSQTNSKQPRTTRNPLFPINHSEAMMRDLMGRLRRHSWLASKRGEFLDLALQMYMAYRNYVRRRRNRDKVSAAESLGFVTRRMGYGELLSWRQDWGKASLHPIGGGRTTVAAMMRVA